VAVLLALHSTPTDPAAFDRHMQDTHVPLAKNIPGVRSVRLSTGPVMTPAGPAPYHAVALLRFDSLGDLQSGMGSPQGQAAAQDLMGFSTGGSTVLIFDDAEV
jgi:uncharacterized protein (TIGR02118 family)